MHDENIAMTEQAKAGLELADVIDGLRQQLAEATERGEGKALRFGVDGIELEVTVAIGGTRGANGEVSFQVLGIGGAVGADGASSSLHTHRIKLSLSLQPEGGGPAKISGRDTIG